MRSGNERPRQNAFRLKLELVETCCVSKKPRIDFRPKRIAEGNWQIEAHCPGEEIRLIDGFTSLEEIHGWMNGPRKIAWLRSQGLAK
jgi:hypothetical protein